MHMRSAEWVISKFGGVTETARQLGYGRRAVQQWRRRGKIPGPAMPKILEKSAEMGLDITCQDLILGREVESGEIKAETSE